MYLGRSRRLATVALWMVLLLPAVAAHGGLPSGLQVDNEVGLAAADTGPAAPLRALGMPYVTAASAPERIAGPGGSQDMVFRCPESPYPMGLPLTTNPDTVDYSCPIRIHDGGNNLGNPAIAVNHQDHREVLFASLHGGGSNGEPHPYSRGGQTHTAFISGDQGYTWRDEFVDRGFISSSARGSFASVTMDSNGNVYLAYLSDMDHGAGAFQSAIAFVKAPPTDSDFGAYSHAYDDAYVLDVRDDGNDISRAWIMDLPSFTPVLPADDEGNETAPPTDGNETGAPAEMLDDANTTNERIVSVWHERADDWNNSSTGLSAWIDWASTDIGSGHNWTRAASDEVIGPCREASNPVYWEDRIYVACVVDRGYQDRARARVGDVDVWSIDVYEGTARLESYTGLQGGRPLMAAARAPSEGFMGVLVQNKEWSDTTPARLGVLHTDVVFGWYAQGWTSGQLGDLGPDLRRMGGGTNVPLLDADVTAFEITSEERTALLVYKEWHDDPQEPEGVDPEDPTAQISNQLLDYNKYFVSFNACDFPIAGFHAQLGQAVDAHNAQNYIDNPAVFNEIQDGLWKTREPHTGEELVYFAISDYGAVQFAALDVLAASDFCGLTTVPPVPPVPIVPQALALQSASSAAIGAAFGVPAVLMLGYLVTVKRRQPSYVTAEDR